MMPFADIDAAVIGARIDTIRSFVMPYANAATALSIVLML